MFRNALIVSIMAVLLFTTQSFAGSSGKISGVVKDAKTGEALFGANVVVEGTNSGASTNEDGYYAILNIPPGTYRLKVSMIGYNTQTIKDVRVNIDLTTNIDIQLADKSLETKEIVIVAKQPVVQKDVAASGVNLNVKEIQNLPVTSVAAVIGLQAGVSGMSVRGGDANQTAFVVNGISMKDGRDNTSYTGISMTSVEQVEVKTGGFNAEFGSIRSGLINVVTKEGDRKHYSFSFFGDLSPAHKQNFGMLADNPNSYLMKSYLDPAVCWTGTKSGAWDAFTQNQYPEFEGWNAVAARTLQDNDPTNDLTPLAAQRLFLWQHRKDMAIRDADYDLDMSLAGPVPMVSEYLGGLRFLATYRQKQSMYMIPLSDDRYRDFNTSFKLTSDLAKGMKLMVEGNYGQQTGTTTSNAGSPGIFSSSDDFGDNIGTNSYLETVMFATDYYCPTTVKRTSIGGKFTHVLTPKTYYEITFNTFQSKYSTNPGRLRDTTRSFLFGNSYYVDEAPYGFWPTTSSGVDGFRMSTGMSDSRDSSKVSVYDAKFDLTSQINDWNNIKTGVEFQYTDNRTSYGRIDPVFFSTNVYNKWNTFPIQAGLYVQDKLEFEMMVANVGLRLDYSDPNGKWWDYSTYQAEFSNELLGQRNNLPKSKLKSKVTLSPRLGVAFPITESSKLFFNYGHFSDLPTPSQLYQVTTLSSGQISYIATPNTDLQKTVAYELGYEQNLLDQFLLRLTGYYKDITNEAVNVNFISKDGKVSYSSPEPVRYRDIRGFEATLTKNRGDWVQGFLNYTYSVASRGYFGWGSYYEASTQQTDYERSSTWRTQYKPSAQPYARANIDLFTPTEWGPKFQSLYPLADWRVNLLANWSSGSYDTWTGGATMTTVNNNVQWRDYWNINVRIMKDFFFGPVNLQLFCEIHNLFNFKRLSSYGFRDDKDQQNYFKSLHFSKDTFDKFPNGTPNYGNATDGSYVYGDDKPGDYRKGAYHAWDPTASEAQKNEWRDNKSYIDMPNLDFFTFLNPRNVMWGMRLNVTL